MNILVQREADQVWSLNCHCTENTLSFQTKPLSLCTSKYMYFPMKPNLWNSLYDIPMKEILWDTLSHTCITFIKHSMLFTTNTENTFNLYIIFTKIPANFFYY